MRPEGMRPRGSENECDQEHAPLVRAPGADEPGRLRDEIQAVTEAARLALLRSDQPDAGDGEEGGGDSGVLV